MAKHGTGLKSPRASAEREEIMGDKATCAKCGEVKELCLSCRSKGIQQPRICKDCLVTATKTGSYELDNELWIKQLEELKDVESLEALNQ